MASAPFSRSTWSQGPYQRPGCELLAKRAARDRFCDALDALDERRAAFVSSPSDLTAEQVIRAEVELEDAVAVAGEFQI